MRNIITLAALVAMMTATTTASAQQFSDTRYGAGETRIAVGITVPFGGGERERQAPRVELSLARDRIAADGSRLSLRAGASQPLRFGLSLEPESRVMINGRPVQGPVDSQNGEQRRASTLGKVGIGIGAALLVAGATIVVLWQIAESNSE